jgi:hypothetical protein
MASIAPSVDLGPVVGRRARGIATWLAMPVAFVAFGIGLALLGGLDDPRPFRAVLVAIATFATLDHLRNVRDRGRLVHEEVEASTRLAETQAHMHDLVAAGAFTPLRGRRVETMGAPGEPEAPQRVDRRPRAARPYG